ncbi:MAG: hypothetical protein GWO19_25815, partial [Nitrospinaceae bacterium]|nr:hypothetical protein [Nitrospinaceae bacterium]NIS87995.1 hypothetical protein [Nitrospinaceae bacterium]
FFGVLSCYLLLRLEEGYRPLRLAAAALALSMFFQARPNTLLVLPLVLVFLHRSVLTSVPEGRRFRGW